MTLASVIVKLENGLKIISDFDCLKQSATTEIRAVLESFEKAIQLEIPSRFMRARLVCDKAIERVAEIRTSGLDLIENTESEIIAENKALFDKNVKQVEQLVKVSMQKMLTKFTALLEDEDG